MKWTQLSPYALVSEDRRWWIGKCLVKEWKYVLWSRIGKDKLLGVYASADIAKSAATRNAEKLTLVPEE